MSRYWLVAMCEGYLLMIATPTTILCCGTSMVTGKKAKAKINRAPSSSPAKNSDLKIQRASSFAVFSPRRRPTADKQNQNKTTATMTDMYDEKKVPEFTLPPYQHEDHGSEVCFNIDF
jgi:hypothetical protein